MWSSPPPHFSFIYENKAYLVVGTEPYCLPACISHNRPILINSSLRATLPLTEFFLHRDKRTYVSVSPETRCVVSVEGEREPAQEAGNHRWGPSVHHWGCSRASPKVFHQTSNISDAKSHKPALWNVPQPVFEGGEPLTPCPFSRGPSTPTQSQAVGKPVPDQRWWSL